MFNFQAGGGSGFQFGATTTSNNAATSNTGSFQAPQATGAFSFGTPSTKAPTFGTQNAFSTNNASSSTTQFSFGSNLQQPQQQQQTQQQQPQQQSALNFSFNTPSTTINTLGTALGGGTGSFSLGNTQPAKTTASSFSGFNLGGFGAVSQNSGASSGLKLGGNIVGGGFSGFGTQNTAASVAATPATQSSFSFGATSTAATTTAAAVGFTPAAATGFSFGATTTAIATVANQSLAGLLGTKSNTATTTTTASLTSSSFNLGAASGTPGFQLGGFGSTATTTHVATATTTTSGGLAAFTLPTYTTSSLFSGSSAISTTTNAALATTTTATATTTATTISSTTTYAQLEEMINRWSEELHGQEKVFLEQATQVNAWDRVLHENGEKISNLNFELEKVKLDHQRLDHDLDLILGQQTELEEILKPLEENVDQQAATYAQLQPQHADIERENIYKLTESIDDDLKKLSVDLKDVIEHINSSGTSSDSNDNVMVQISNILNSHMDSLQWIDRNTETLQRRVDEFSHQLTEKNQTQNSYPPMKSLYANSHIN